MEDLWRKGMISIDMTVSVGELISDLEPEVVIGMADVTVGLRGVVLAEFGEGDKIFSGPFSTESSRKPL